MNTNFLIGLFALTMVSAVYMYFMVRWCVKNECIKDSPFNLGLILIPGVNILAAILFTSVIVVATIDQFLFEDGRD